MMHKCPVCGSQSKKRQKLTLVTNDKPKMKLHERKCSIQKALNEVRDEQLAIDMLIVRALMKNGDVVEWYAIEGADARFEK